MQVSLENISSVEKKLTVSIPEGTLESEYTKQIDRFAKTAKIKGFRPGKAPASYIQKYYGAEARSEAYKNVVGVALIEAIKEQQLKPIGQPHVEPKEIVAGQPLEFIATIEVLPEIEAVSFSLDKLEKLQVAITDDDVNHVIQQLQKQYTKWKHVDRAAELKDRVVIDYSPVDEEQNTPIQNHPIELGSKTMFPGFEDGLVGAKAGDEITLNLNYPDDYSVKEKVGQPVVFSVKIKEVYEAEIPELDDKFIKQLGIKSTKIEELQDQIRKSLTQERDRLLKEKLKEQIFSKLLEQNAVDVPKILIAQEAKNIHDEFYPQHHDHSNHSHDETTAFNDIAKKRVALSLIIGAYAKLNNLTVDPAKVEQRMQEIASLYESPTEVLAWLRTPERKSGIESQVLEDQILEKLMEGISSTDTTMSYAELKGIQT